MGSVSTQWKEHNYYRINALELIKNVKGLQFAVHVSGFRGIFIISFLPPFLPSLLPSFGRSLGYITRRAVPTAPSRSLPSPLGQGRLLRARSVSPPIRSSLSSDTGSPATLLIWQSWATFNDSTWETRVHKLHYQMQTSQAEKLGFDDKWMNELWSLVIISDILLYCLSFHHCVLHSKGINPMLSSRMMI